MVGDSTTPRPPLPPGKTRYPLYRRLGVPRGRSGRTENLVPTGIRPRTVQSMAQSLYRLSYPAHMCTLYPKKTFKSYYDVLHITSHLIPADRRLQITLL